MSTCQPDVAKYNNIWEERHQLVLMRGKVEMESHGGRCKGGDTREEEVSFLEAKREAMEDVRIELHGSRRDLARVLLV